jgi:hypothetical protein
MPCARTAALQGEVGLLIVRVCGWTAQGSLESFAASEMVGSLHGRQIENRGVDLQRVVDAEVDEVPFVVVVGHR